MPKPAITTFANLTTRPSLTNRDYIAIYVPQLTTSQITNIPAPDLINGAVVYNITTNSFQLYQNGAWMIIGSGAGIVSGPAVSVRGNIAVFDNTTGNLIADSGVSIGRVPAP